MRPISLLAMTFFTAFFSSFAWAHIPEYDTIMTRVAANHGNGAYQIQRTLKWTENGTPMELSEMWTVGEGGQMKLQVSGTGRLQGQLGGEINYTGDRKATFAEPLFFLRSSKALRSLLVRMNLAPRASLENRPPLGTGPTVKYKPQEFLSLSRVDGVITYAVGNSAHPTLFIEQDQFVISKLAYPSGPVVIAKGYQSYPNSFYFPKTVTYTWGNHVVEAVTQKVTSLGKRPIPAAANSALKLPDSPTIQGFYAEFR